MWGLWSFSKLTSSARQTTIEATVNIKNSTTNGLEYQLVSAGKILNVNFGILPPHGNGRRKSRWNSRRWSSSKQRRKRRDRKRSTNIRGKDGQSQCMQKIGMKQITRARVGQVRARGQQGRQAV
jgi:hypothetical protein